MPRPTASKRLTFEAYESRERQSCGDDGSVVVRRPHFERRFFPLGDLTKQPGHSRVVGMTQRRLIVQAPGEVRFLLVAEVIPLDCDRARCTNG